MAGQQWFMANRSGHPITYSNWTCVQPTKCEGNDKDPHQCALEALLIGWDIFPVVLGDQTCIAVGGVTFGDVNSTNETYNVPWYVSLAHPVLYVSDCVGKSCRSR